MATGLIALLDDVAAIAKLAASSLDDVAAAAGRAGAKAAGVVIDDAAVTPRYVVGFHPSRELPIIRRIALGSLRNKLLVLLPAALALAAFAPVLITPLLMLGGLYLCFEGTEKAAEWLFPHAAGHGPAEAAPDAGDPRRLEDAKVAGAIKTDFILSAEIMAITLAAIPEGGFWMRAAVLAVVAVAITVAVYGVVALIVKADDLGLALTRRPGPLRALGGAVVRGMPAVLTALSVVGTAAMVWVGGGILLHGLEEYGLAGLPHLVHDAAHAAGAAAPAAAAGAVEWIVTAGLSGVVGLAAGAALIPLVSRVIAPLAARLRPA